MAIAYVALKVILSEYVYICMIYDYYAINGSLDNSVTLSDQPSSDTQNPNMKHYDGSLNKNFVKTGMRIAIRLRNVVTDLVKDMQFYARKEQIQLI